jgi:hypothetical protein
MPSVATTPAIRHGFRPSRSSAIKTSTTKTQKHRTAKNAKNAKKEFFFFAFSPFAPFVSFAVKYFFSFDLKEKPIAPPRPLRAPKNAFSFLFITLCALCALCGSAFIFYR